MVAQFANQFNNSVSVDELLKKIVPESIESSLDMVNRLFSGGRQIGDLLGAEPKALETVYAVATTMYNNDRYIEALKLFKILSVLNHLNKRYFLGLASTLQMLGRYKEAVQTYSYCYLMDGENPKIPFNSAVCHIMLNNWTEAESGLNYAEMLIGSENSEWSDLSLKIKVLRRKVEKNITTDHADQKEASNDHDAALVG